MSLINNESYKRLEPYIQQKKKGPKKIGGNLTYSNGVTDRSEL